jgi:two-component system CheB/CheR fusion protein
MLYISGRFLQPDGETFFLVTFEDITAHKEIERMQNLERDRLANEVASTARELGRTQEELRALAASLFNSQEDERRRVARELHDDISQKLAVLEIDAHQVEERIATDPQALQELQQVRARIGELSDAVRRISHGLHPSAIDDLGIVPAVRALTEDFREREQMIVTLTVQDLPENISARIATGLYRIAQEALRNIAKHAGRTHVKVILKGSSGGIRLQVIDHGHGFDPQSPRSGLGLISMEERARMMEGTFRVESEPHSGTRITVDVPWTKTAAS